MAGGVDQSRAADKGKVSPNYHFSEVIQMANPRLTTMTTIGTWSYKIATERMNYRFECLKGSIRIVKT